MPNLKSIKRKIASIKNTRQITKAMKMVAGAKFKKKSGGYECPQALFGNLQRRHKKYFKKYGLIQSSIF